MREPEEFNAFCRNNGITVRMILTMSEQELDKLLEKFKQS